MTSSPQFLLGVDLGGSKIEAAILGPDSEIVARRRLPTPRSGYQDILASITNLTRGLELDFAPQLHGQNCLPLGIGTPGSPSPANEAMRNSNTIALNGRQLRLDLEQYSGRRVRLANDADCFTLSEAQDGAGAACKSVFGVILGTGVGGGVCINRQLLQGPNRVCGEWGHNRLALERVPGLPAALRGARPCYCGNWDCVETWLSGPGLAATHQQLHGYALDIERLHDRPLISDYADTMHAYINLLAAALGAVINVLDPDCVVLGGGLSNIEAIYEQLPEMLVAQVFSDICYTKVFRAVHGDSGGVRGAAWLWNAVTPQPQ